MTVNHMSHGRGFAEKPKMDVTPARIFAGIKIEATAARELSELARPLASCAVRLVPKNDLHLTLVPPWNESGIARTVERLGIIASGFNCFSLAFEHLGYGPTLRHPRLLWAGCVVSCELKELRMTLLAAFGREDARPFHPHVTLARIPQNGRSFARKYPIDRPLTLTQCVRSVELFQSPSKGESGYQVLSSSPLAGGSL